jgi:hypothetical protein
MPAIPKGLDADYANWFSALASLNKPFFLEYFSPLVLLEFKVYSRHAIISRLMSLV